MKELIYKDEAYKIIGACMEIHKELGFGFLENVYEKALLIVFQEKGLSFQKQTRFDVRFRDHVIGDFIAV